MSSIALFLGAVTKTSLRNTVITSNATVYTNYLKQWNDEVKYNIIHEVVKWQTPVQYCGYKTNDNFSENMFTDH